LGSSVVCGASDAHADTNSTSGISTASGSNRRRQDLIGAP
jgi:hypothetical protein